MITRIIRKIENFLFRYAVTRKMLPDSSFLKCLWRRSWGRELDLKNPRTLNEKLQWLKLHDRNPLYTTFVDKVAVKEWIRAHYGDEYVIPTIATFSSTDEIDFSKLPDKFAIKCNHDSGSCSICMDRNSFDFEKAKEKLNNGLVINWYDLAKEWPYKNIKKRLIMCEPLLLTNAGSIPNDYKLHYLNGKLQFVYVSFDRQGINDRCTYDENWNRLPFLWIPAGTYRDNMNTADVPCPPSFARMKEIGSEVAKMFKCVRVDFYDVDGRLFFGEITMFHGSGYDRFFPEEYDIVYGNKLSLK